MFIEFDFILDLIVGIVDFTFPSKDKRKVNTYLKLLKKDPASEKFSYIFTMNGLQRTKKVRQFILEQPVEVILQDEQQKKHFFTQLEKVCVNEGL